MFRVESERFQGRRNVRRMIFPPKRLIDAFDSVAWTIRLRVLNKLSSRLGNFKRNRNDRVPLRWQRNLKNFRTTRLIYSWQDFLIKWSESFGAPEYHGKWFNGTRRNLDIWHETVGTQVAVVSYRLWYAISYRRCGSMIATVISRFVAKSNYSRDPWNLIRSYCSLHSGERRKTLCHDIARSSQNVSLSFP